MHTVAKRWKLLLFVNASLWSTISFCEWEKILGDWINVFIPYMMNEMVAWFRLWGCLKDVKYFKKNHMLLLAWTCLVYAFYQLFVKWSYGDNPEHENHLYQHDIIHYILIDSFQEQNNWSLSFEGYLNNFIQTFLWATHLYMWH